MPIQQQVEAPSHGTSAVPPAPAPVPAFDDLQVKLEGPEDPRNWSSFKKWSTATIISLMGFIGPLGASIIIASANGITAEFRIGRSHPLSVLPVSLFVLGLGAGPFCLAPASELKGRQPVYLLSSIVFVLFNIGCSVSPNFAALCILRFFAGVFGSSGPSLGAGTIGDMFAPNERGSAQAIYGLGPLLGPVVGNIVGGWVDQSGEKNWRWLLWILTILSGLVAISVFFLPETFAPVLLQQKRKRVAAERLERIQELQHEQASTFHSTEAAQQLAALAKKPTAKERAMALVPGRQAKDKMKIAFSRPFRLLFTNPICATFSCYMGFCYGVIFLFLVEHPLLYQKRPPEEHGEFDRDRVLHNYQWAPGPTGLTYLGLGLGFLIAASCNALCQDRIYRRLVASRGKVGWYLFKQPEEIDLIMQRRDKVAADDEDLEGTAQESIDVPSVVGPVPPPSARTKAEQAGDKSAASPPLGPSQEPKAAGPPPPPRKGEPEFRLPLCLAGMFVLPVGLFIFGWTAASGVHWILPLVGSVFVGAGTILCFQSILVYLVDAFIPYSASATACAVLVRSVLAAAFPLFADKMYHTLGYGWGSSLLAFVALAGVPVPLVLFRYGAFLRQKYKFVA
ncbi:MFS general substrate transporter [Microstroma glucosiphilum]|uniref:MFS general substrate transporter n=1 Tax=Pseudomicrostroma glucosiphilum TaxID=1684307 RepID=A0A316UFX0_9BASI|nr:MFS general substrate transporter [Pseudomicrostroma glucosiphilum]PWN22803.1 MFS general substrate transporter [Pseudomicrostroma glucosiphilum]